MIDGYSYKELLEVYININKYIKTKNWKRSYNLDSFWNDFNYFKKNIEVFWVLFDENKKNIDLILSIQDSIEKKKRELKTEITNKWLVLNKQNLLEKISKLEEELENTNDLWITCQKDIDELINEKYWKKELPYNKRDIIIAKARLTPTFEHENQRTIEKVKLRFYNAWHVEWSIMASISVITKKVDRILNWIKTRPNNRWFNSITNIRKEYINFLFTWDMWKFTDPNISWSPDIPDLKYDYVQFESTYSDRNHPDKKKEFQKFIYKLNTNWWKNLIPAFSFQRIQEIIVELLQNKLDNLDLIEKYPKLIKKIKKIKRDYWDILNKNIEDLDEKDKILRVKKYWEISAIEKEINYIHNTVFLWKIIVDAPLWVKISEVFLRNFPDKYKLLDPAYQKEMFWEEQVTILWQWDYRKLYKWSRSQSRDIILSSWWMMQWWAILNHAKQIISDKNSKIFFTWYQAENTLWWKIISWEKRVSIDWEFFDVNAQKISIWWYSSHIPMDDIIDFVANKLNLSKKAVLASVHWLSNRKYLVNAILEVNNKLNCIIPNMWDKHYFDL
jgi:Cft2 family RNA processing exonuclease